MNNYIELNSGTILKDNFVAIKVIPAAKRKPFAVSYAHPKLYQIVYADASVNINKKDYQLLKEYLKGETNKT